MVFSLNVFLFRFLPLFALAVLKLSPQSYSPLLYCHCQS